MEPLFENTHTRDRQFFKEFYAYALFRRPILICSFAVIILAFSVNLLSFLCFDEPVSLWLFVAPAFLLIYVVLYFANVRISVARENENADGAATVYTVQLTETAVILSTSLGTRIEMEYSKFKKLTLTKHFLLLQTKTKQVFPLKKNGFTVGTYEECRAFLRAKNLK